MTETEMRDARVPWPKTEEELVSYIKGLVEQEHDYGTCVYAMSMAATAALYYVGSRLGVSGAQASCADLDILRRTRHMEHGFCITNYADLLYPQYWNEAATAAIFREVLRDPEQKPRFVEAAKKMLAEETRGTENVRAHWQKIADGRIP